MRYINNARPNVIRGGQAISIGNNMFYMKGKKHSQGGIDIGKDLEVEGGEIMQITPTEYKVFSAKKFLGGYSPAEKILAGANPNRVFNEQENYKDRNNLNDDGTKKAEFGKTEKLKENEVSPMTGYFWTKASNVTNWGNATEITDSKGNKRTTEWVLANMPDYKVMTDINGNAITGTSSNQSTISTENNGTNPNTEIKANFPTLITNDESSDTKYYTDRFGHFTPNRAYLSGIPIEASNDLFYLTAPYLGLEDYIIGKGIQKGLSFTGKVAKNLILNNALKIDSKNINNATHTTIDNNKQYYIPNIKNFRIDNNNIDKNINNQLIEEALKRESNIPLIDNFGNKLNLSNLKPETLIRYKGNSFYEVGEHRVGINIKDPNIKSTIHHEDNHYKRDIISEHIDDALFENRLDNYRKLKQTTYKINRVKNDAGAFTPEEQNILDDAYSFTDDFIKDRKGDISVLQEKASSNIELKDAIIEYLKLPNNVDKNILNKKINNLSNNEIMLLLANTNGYTQNFYTKIEKQLIDSGVDMDAPFYVLEDNGVFNNPIINKQINDIKKALTTVGVSSGVIATSTNNETKDKKAMGGIKRLHPFTGGKKRADLGTEEFNRALTTDYYTFGYTPRRRKIIKTNNNTEVTTPVNTNSGVNGEALSSEMNKDYYTFGYNVPNSGTTFRYNSNSGIDGNALMNEAAKDYYTFGYKRKPFNLFNSNQELRFAAPNKQQLYFAAPNELPQVVGPEVVFTATKPNNTVPTTPTAVATTPSPVKGTSTTPASIRTTRRVKPKVITPFTDPSNYAITTDDDKASISRNTKDIIPDIEVPNIPTRRVKVSHNASTTNSRHKGKVTVTTNDDGTTTYTDSATGAIVPEPIKPLTFKQKVTNFLTDNGEDIISNVSNIAGSLISHGLNRRAINKMQAPSAPIPKMATKMKTTFNANPQLTEVNNNYNASARNNINETSSSATAQNRINRLNNWRTSARNQIYGNKENVETQLINQDRLNQQQVAHVNVDTYNQYLDRLTEFNNRKIDLSSENDQALISGINSTIQNTLTNRKKFRQDLLNGLLMYGAHPNSQEFIKNLSPALKRMIEKAIV